MKTMREWLFPVAVMLTWGVGFSYTLVRLGEAHRAHSAAAIARALPQPAPASHLIASAQ